MSRTNPYRFHFTKEAPGWDIDRKMFHEVRGHAYTNELFNSPNGELEIHQFRVHLSSTRSYKELFFCGYCKELSQPLWILSRLCI